MTRFPGVERKQTTAKADPYGMTTKEQADPYGMTTKKQTDSLGMTIKRNKQIPSDDN
jgi:hypothetical protein